MDLLQKYFAQCLLGRNLTQTIMLLTGSGGSGKGTLANILEMIVSSSNCMQIRPGCIGRRFETNSFVGKTLLTGKESQTSFFTTKGMGILKSLVGDDALRVEFKHSNEAQMIQGTYNVFIVGNAVPVLEFESEDDISAWHSNQPEPRISHFLYSFRADCSCITVRYAGTGRILEAQSIVKSLRVVFFLRTSEKMDGICTWESLHDLLFDPFLIRSPRGTFDENTFMRPINLIMSFVIIVPGHFYLLFRLSVSCLEWHRSCASVFLLIPPPFL